MEIADSITVRYLSLAILFANAAPPLLLFAIFEQFQSICNLQGRCEATSHTAVPPAKVMYYSRSVMYLPSERCSGPSRRGEEAGAPRRRHRRRGDRIAVLFCRRAATLSHHDVIRLSPLTRVKAVVRWTSSDVR